MPSPNITNPLIGLQNWVANQVKEDPILEKRIKLPDMTSGSKLTKKEGVSIMGSQLFKAFIRKVLLSKQGPPGPPPRQGLQWKPTTHRWIRPKEEKVRQGDRYRHDDDLGSATEDYWADFDINEHTERIENYIDEVWTDYNHLPVDKIKAEILMPLIEDLDIVMPQDDEGMDNAREALEEYVGEAVQRKQLSSPEKEYQPYSQGNPPHFKAYGDPFFDGQFMDAIKEGGKSGVDTSFGGDYNFEPLKDALREVSDDEGAIEEFINSEEVRSAISNTISDPEDYWVNFDINEHKDDIKNYIDAMWEIYEDLSPDKIQDKILMPLIEDLDMVLPQDDEKLDMARESLEGYLGEAIQRKKLSSMGRSGRQLGKMGERNRQKR